MGEGSLGINPQPRSPQLELQRPRPPLWPQQPWPQLQQPQPQRVRIFFCELYKIPVGPKKIDPLPSFFPEIRSMSGLFICDTCVFPLEGIVPLEGDKIAPFIFPLVQCCPIMNTKRGGPSCGNLRLLSHLRVCSLSEGECFMGSGCNKESRRAARHFFGCEDKFCKECALTRILVLARLGHLQPPFVRDWFFKFKGEDDWLGQIYRLWLEKAFPKSPSSQFLIDVGGLEEPHGYQNWITSINL